MLKPQGYATVTLDAVLERDTISCGHCGKIVFIKPGTFSTVYLIYHFEGPPTEEPGAACSICRRAVCLTCHDDGRCLPLDARVEHAEKTGQWLG